MQCLLTAKKGKWGLGVKPQKMFGTTPFQSNEDALFDIKKALQKGHFGSFAEKGRDPEPQDPLIAPLTYAFMNNALTVEIHEETLKLVCSNLL